MCHSLLVCLLELRLLLLCYLHVLLTQITLLLQAALQLFM
jgi:hypothetical protein